MNLRFSVAMQKWPIIQVISKKSAIYIMPKDFEQVSERESVHHLNDLILSQDQSYMSVTAGRKVLLTFK